MSAVADDNDVLVILVHDWKQNMASIYFLLEVGKKLKISNMAVQVGTMITSYLPFLHAWSGCVTT